MRQACLSPRFVEFVPEQLEDGILYISRRFRTAVHKCCCGCGEEVITPLSPVDWSLREEGDAVSLHPSVGNWSIPCQSHYWIRRNKVIWAEKMSKERIELGRKIDHAARLVYLEEVNHRKAQGAHGPGAPPRAPQSDSYLIERLWLAIKRWWSP